MTFHSKTEGSNRDPFAGLIFKNPFNVKGTTSIKMREIDPSHVKETSTCYLLVGDKLNTQSCL